MQSHAAPTTKTIDLDAIERFWERESRRMAERNAALSGAFRAAKEEIVRRRAEREHVVVTCMDERAAHVDEVLGHLPGEAPVYASGGGKIDIDTFEALYGGRIADSAKAGKTARVFLVPHECSHDGRLGCAAFGNDTEAQRQFFTDLKREILERHPGTRVHVLAMCTTKHDLRVIDAHAKDAHLRQVHAASSGFNPLVEDTQHAGYGIYVGDAYRAWVPGRNAYFRLSSLNPDIAGNAAIALKVMEHHSDVDLSTKPIVLHADYPVYADAVWTKAARMNIDGQLDAFLSSPAAREKAAAGALKVIKTETDTETWAGRLL